MKKDDYKTEFEEHRKEISLDEGHDVENLPSRTELHSKGRKPKKKSGHLLINVILGLFTLIPVLILVYFLSDFYLPEDSTKAKVDNSGSIYEVNKESSGKKEDSNTDVALENKDDEDSKESEKGIDKVESETKLDSETKTETKVEEKPATKPVVNVNPAPEQKPEQNPTGKTHTVANGETLYRIALNYYGVGSEAGIEKIKRANGLSSNEIKTGQKLIIP